MPTLKRITIYPIKSLDGHDVTTARILPSGALQHDRRYALVDGWGKFVHGKQCPAVHRIRAKFDDCFLHVTLSCDDLQETFSLANEQLELAQWCSQILDKKCRLVENAEVGMPDDCEAPGPTLISTATLQEVSSWFDGLSLAEVRRRFRANLEIHAKKPFWEDRLVAARTQVRRFRIGNSVWQGRGICERCVVPTRDSLDGTVVAGFAREFSRRRQETLPEWSPPERFDHFYRLAINTGLDCLEGEPLLRVGDSVAPIEDSRLANHR